jgi:hypothetical protein
MFDLKQLNFCFVCSYYADRERKCTFQPGALLCLFSASQWNTKTQFLAALKPLGVKNTIALSVCWWHAVTRPTGVTGSGLQDGVSKCIQQVL